VSGRSPFARGGAPLIIWGRKRCPQRGQAPRRFEQAGIRRATFGCAIVDALAVAAGVLLTVIPEMDSIASWPANDMLISPLLP